MRAIWIITKRELASFFDSLTAYVILVLFLVFTGLFTWIMGDTIFYYQQASLAVFFNISKLSLFFFIPAITMRTLAEENKTGTIELLITKAITDWQIVLGKFLSCFLLVSISIGCTLIYYFSVAYIAETSIDHGAVIGGYLGMLLMSGAYISIGIFASSLTNNQIIAFLAALFIAVFFHFITMILANSFTGGLGDIFNYLSLQSHFDSIARGVVDARDIVYFFSVMFLGLIFSQVMLSKRNWKK